MRETLRRLFIALLWAAVLFFVMVFGWASGETTDDEKAWIVIILGGGGWVVHKVINWISHHKEIS